MKTPQKDAEFRPLSHAEAAKFEQMLNADQANGNQSLGITPQGEMKLVNRNEVDDTSELTTTAGNMGTNYVMAN